MKRSMIRLSTLALALTCFAGEASPHSLIVARGGMTPAATGAQARPSPAPVSAQFNAGRVGAKHDLGGHFNARPTSAPGSLGLNGGRVGAKNDLGGHFNARPTRTGERSGNLDAGRMGSASQLKPKGDAGRPSPTPAKLGFGSAKNTSNLVKAASAARDLAPTRPDEQFFFHTNSMQSKSQGNRSRSTTRSGR